MASIDNLKNEAFMHSQLIYVSNEGLFLREEPQQWELDGTFTDSRARLATPRGDLEAP